MTDDETDADRPLFVRELIRRVHRELVESRAEREREGLPPIFQVESMTVEVHFVAVEARGVRGGLDFRVITAGGERRYEEQQVHKITLSLGAVAGRTREESGDSDPNIGAFGDLEEGASRFMPREQH